MGMMIIHRKKITNFIYLFKIHNSKGNFSEESSGWVGGGNTNACPSGNNI